MEAILQYVLYLVILVALAIPLGKYIGKIMDGETVFLSKILRPVERGIYKILHVKEDEEMGWKRYAGSVFMFSILALAVLMLMHMFQGFLPWNPQGQKGISWDLAFNNAVSFITNTNWQAYSLSLIHI